MDIQTKILEKIRSKPTESEMVYVYDCGECVFKGKSEKEIPSKYNGLPKQIIKNDKEYQKELKIYQKELDELYKEAFSRLEEYMGWQDIDREIVTWIKYKCYNENHAYGYGAVLQDIEDYDELVELIRASLVSFM